MKHLKPYLGTVIVVLVVIAVFKAFLTPAVAKVSPTLAAYLPS